MNYQSSPFNGFPFFWIGQPPTPAIAVRLLRSADAVLASMNRPVKAITGAGGWINSLADDFIVIFPDSYRGLMQHAQNRWSIKTLWHC